MTNPDSPEWYGTDEDSMRRAFIDQHRDVLLSCLDGLTEEEARHQLVSSKTTLLGLVKHATFVEGVWFAQAATGGTRAELGIPETPDESFDLDDGDTIVSVRSAYAAAIQRLRDSVTGVTGDTIWTGNKRGPLPLRWIELHVLRELAQHCGHADILREQIEAYNSSKKSSSIR